MNQITKDVGFTVGQRVELVEPGIRGTVQQVLFNIDGIQYQVAYWDGSVRRVEWVLLHEIESIKLPVSATNR